jgi:hypothetical protein
MLDMPGAVRANDPEAVKRPQPSQGPAHGFGGDRVAGVLRTLDIPHVVPSPGTDMQGAPTKEAKPDGG